MTNIQPVQTQPQVFTFDLYELNKGGHLIVSSKLPKRIEVRKHDITIHNLKLFERSIAYLSLSQQVNLPTDLKDNTGFMNYIRACRFIIPSGYLPMTLTDHEFNSDEGLKLMKLSAEQGFAPAQWNLAICSQFGIAMEKNLIEAIYYYQQAAEQGIAKAQTRLASLYDQGQGTPKNRAKAFEWYEKAAIQGIAVAQYNLGWYYGHGIHVSQDLHKSLEWFKKAATQGFREAKNGIIWAKREIKKLQTKALQEEAAKAQQAAINARTQPGPDNHFQQILLKMQEREALHKEEMQAMEKRHQEEIQKKDERHQDEMRSKEARHQKQIAKLEKRFNASIQALHCRIEMIESRGLDHQVIRWTLQGQASLLPEPKANPRPDQPLDNIPIEELSDAPSASPESDLKPKKRVRAANGNNPKRQQLSPKEGRQKS